MHRSLPIALTLFVLVACGGSPKSQLIGTWTLDLEAFKEMDDFKKASDAEKQMMTAMMSSMNVEITFTDTKATMSMQMMGQTNNEEGDYQVVKEDGNILTLEITDKDGKTDTVIVEVDGDRLVFQEGDEKFALKRK